MKDTLGAMVFLALFAIIMFFMPEGGGYFLEYNNFIPADPLKTPSHIAPVWYFTPYYSILRATTANFMWVLAAGVVLYALLILAGRFPGRTKAAAVAVSIRAAGRVFHAGPESVGRRADGRRRDDFLPHAVARREPGEIHPLQGRALSKARSRCSSSCSSCLAITARNR